ncbi:MAG: amidohydrolase family protein [Vicinamibacterales bacterium]
MWWRRSLTFVNARVVGPDGRIASTLRVTRTRVDGLGVAPDRSDAVVDLQGAVVLPGLVNAHDHLELNTLPRLKWRDRHENVRQWIADFQPRFATDPHLRALGPDTLDARVWVGGLKNLLAGVTTVCHHNPLHPVLRRRFPIRVVRRFTFSHSLQIDGDALVRAHHATPPDRPWVVHAGEGVDADAHGEIPRLHRLGCLDRRTVVVHGVAACRATAQLMIEAGAGLVWCPSSNDWLFGTTADVRPFDDADRLALGSDSRLSGAGDLLDELRAAFATRQVSAVGLTRLVTSGAAALLRLPEAGRLAPGAPADLVVLGGSDGDPYDVVVGASRGDVRLTMIGGLPAVAEPGLREVFDATRTPALEARLDGAPRIVAEWIGRRARALGAVEPGFEVAA